ncbi:heme exporter protein CcmD [Dongia rigui]|uniref:Heme exporter protein D n=1 Tax=Dongia rigui TaxID=940149 RepID=A0ABU5DX81_9PROT|nr:heme exporter protein CcmD [Dongia rigui]MDY0871549.1 heme exporter protein CcmD [Dongia rigui]
MSDFGSFLAMGGYAAYVWPAYGAAVVILAAIWIDGQRRRRAVDQALAKLDQQRKDER